MMIQPSRRETAIALVALFVAAAAMPSHADTEPASAAVDSSARGAMLSPAPPDIDSMIDENPDFNGLEYPVPANINRQPAVLPATAIDADDDSFPSEDAD